MCCVFHSRDQFGSCHRITNAIVAWLLWNCNGLSPNRQHFRVVSLNSKNTTIICGWHGGVVVGFSVCSVLILLLAWISCGQAVQLPPTIQRHIIRLIGDTRVHRLLLSDRWDQPPMTLKRISDIMVKVDGTMTCPYLQPCCSCHAQILECERTSVCTDWCLVSLLNLYFLEHLTLYFPACNKEADKKHWERERGYGPQQTSTAGLELRMFLNLGFYRILCEDTLKKMCGSLPHFWVVAC